MANGEEDLKEKNKGRKVQPNPKYTTCKNF